MRETLGILLLVLAAAILALILITSPRWLPTLQRVETCADCVERCKPFAVRTCMTGYSLSCYCDATLPAPVEK